MSDCFCECSDLKDKNQRIHELEEKICAYKAKVRDLYQVDILDLKKTIRCLKERIEELECENERLNEFVSPSKVLLIFHDDTDQFELFCNGHEIADQVYDALKQAERRIEELRVENEKLKRENGFIKLRDGFVKFESQIDELEDDNKKLKSLNQHLINHVSNKEAEIVNLKEENEKLWCENKKLKRENERLESQLAVRDASSIWESVVVSYPKGKKISNVELYFQEE